MPRHLLRRTGVVVALGLTTLVLGTGAAAADDAGATFTATRCLTGDGWGAVLSVTAAHPEHQPVARISTAAGPYTVAVPAGGYSTLLTGSGDDISAAVHLSWNDATTRDLGTLVAERPGDCVEPAATPATPPVTSCAEAIPPRADCGSTTPTVAPAAGPARLDVDATLLAVPARTETRPAAHPSPHQPAHPAPHQPDPRRVALPATGSTTAVVIGAGIVTMLAGVALVLAVRRVH